MKYVRLFEDFVTESVSEEIEKVVKKYFPDATFDVKDNRWEAFTDPNKSDKWEKPENLVKFESEADSKFAQYLSGTSWDDNGNITIGVRGRAFEANLSEALLPPTAKQIFKDFFMKNVGKEVELEITEFDGTSSSDGKIEANKAKTMYKIGDLWFELDWFIDGMKDWKIKTFKPDHIHFEWGGTEWNLKLNNT